MSVSGTRRILIADCNSIIKRYSYFYTQNKTTFYPFDRFCNVLIESIVHTRPSIIYATTSSPIDNLWRRQLYNQYQATFLSSMQYPIYNNNVNILDELLDYIPIINHIKCPLQNNESGDLISSIINQHTTNNDAIFVLAQPKKYEQLLSFNDNNKRNVNYMKVIRKDDDIEDDELNFAFTITKDNLFELPENNLVIDYLSLIGIKSDDINGIKGIGPVRAKKLLKYGNVSYLLNNDEWKTQLSTTQARLFDENADILEFFYKKLIPFDKQVKLDEIVINNVKTLDSDYFEHNDSISLLQSMKPFAQKYQLKSLLWRLGKVEPK